ncbi:EF2563 family selenium-dependent molybdenum hydroxylase system protein [Clostridium sp. NSJ-145]|uniref:selenium-dependent molybdenum cofactor biosynthesis protein YqeB n=1 Tax=Clostridium sp. NSJ-145 TaxID=2897777 RepID=UPI001E45C5F9|nr:selenium-dependent molybdenum cofactor biosynthesis protein YqeB [Clostridium sp. NSJ-145]MCD2502696.1 EF2563 family selenium-dependent molybdenum hydroxylase system protein [Clostridium sp. NSJ-145]
MLVLIKGAGDLATGVAHRLKRCGFDVVMTEIEEPTTVRRTVAFSQAVYDCKVEVEGVKATLVKDIQMIRENIDNGIISVIVDKDANIIEVLKPDIVVDAIVAKKNTGTSIDDAPIVIALGPGFEAGVDCDLVIETKRGHYLGRVITKGKAIPNTGVPGNIGGHTVGRIIRATSDGIINPVSEIGDYVEEGQVVAYIDKTPVYASISGIVRGMLQGGIEVFEGMKSGDIDPRCKKEHCFTISDKARSIGGGVLEGILFLKNK